MEPSPPFPKNSPNKNPKNWKEGRRLRGYELHQQGWPQKEIAAALGVTPGAVSQWMKRAAEKGAESLKDQPPPGASARLNPEQVSHLKTLLERGAEANGFKGEVWTCPRLVELIRKETGVIYTPKHAGRLLKAWGYSRQKPIRRATQRDD